VAMAVHGLQTAPFWLAMGGVVLAWFFYLVRPGDSGGDPAHLPADPQPAREQVLLRPLQRDRLRRRRTPARQGSVEGGRIRA